MTEDLSNKEEVFHQIIHDLKSPLAAILGLSEIFLKMLSADLKENQKDVVRKIHNHTKFALTLVEDILDVALISSGRLQIVKAPVQAKPYIDSVVHGHIINAAEKTITINVFINHDCIIHIDERRITQVLNNLLSNAIKFSYRGSVIDFVAFQEGDYYFFQVKDKGVGIKETELSQLFKPFSQLSNNPTANEKSTGLGLSIVRNLVDLHQGDIYVESVEGQGSTFTVKIPL